MLEAVFLPCLPFRTWLIIDYNLLLPPWELKEMFLKFLKSNFYQRLVLEENESSKNGSVKMISQTLQLSYQRS